MGQEATEVAAEITPHKGQRGKFCPRRLRYLGIGGNHFRADAARSGKLLIGHKGLHTQGIGHAEAIKGDIHIGLAGNLGKGVWR